MTTAATPARRRQLLPAAALPLALLLLPACEVDVDVPEPEHTPRVALALVLDNQPGADSLRRQDIAGRMPYVSVSQRLYDLTPLNGRATATVEVRDEAGTVVERYRPLRSANMPSYYTQGQYQPVLHYQFRPGQTYSVRATVPGYETAESRLTMPTEVPLQATLTPTGGGNGGSGGRVNVTFDDPGAGPDYYLVLARVTDGSGQRTGYLNIEREDPGTPGGNITPYQLTAANSTWELYPFSDASVNGQRISFASDVSYYSNTGGRTQYLEISLCHLTRDQYLFYNSYRLYTQNDGNPFAEPTPLYSNVAAGFGIFGGVTESIVRIPL